VRKLRAEPEHLEPQLINPELVRYVMVWTWKDDGAPAGTVIPADANLGVSPFWIWTLSRQFFGLFPPRLPAERLPKLPS